MRLRAAARSLLALLHPLRAADRVERRSPTGSFIGRAPVNETAQDRSQSYAVRIWFRERGQLVYDDVGPFDRYLAELTCVSMADGWVRGGVHVHVERALIVPWLV